MSDDEDDYLSDKFLLSAEPPKSVPKPTTYSEIRKVAARDSELRQEQGKRKSRHQIEKENREEALSKSLFQREEEEKALGLSSGSKALSMMMKMGFQPGQSLGAESNSRSGDVAEDEATSSSREDSATDQRPAGHSKVPLPLHEWSGACYPVYVREGRSFLTLHVRMVPGKKEAGIGVRKRPASPLSHDLVAKMVKMNEDKDKTSFRDRAREQYLERQASGRLRPVQRTCVSLDEKNGQTVSASSLSSALKDLHDGGLSVVPDSEFTGIRSDPAICLYGKQELIRFFDCSSTSSGWIPTITTLFLPDSWTRCSLRTLAATMQRQMHTIYNLR